MGKKHKRQSIANKAKTTPQAASASHAPTSSGSSVASPPIPGAFELPLTPPESPIFPRPVPAKIPSASPPSSDAPSEAIRSALDHLSLGFPGAAYEALQAALPGLRAGQAVAEQKELVDKQAYFVRSVQTRLDGKDWTGALSSLDAAERGWKALGRETPWEGVKWRLEGLSGAKKWSEVEKLSSTSLILRPSDAQLLLYYHALSQYQLGKIELAISTAERALKARTGKDRIVDKVKTLLDRMSTVLRHKSAGKEAFQAQKHDEAIKQYTAALFVEGENQVVRSLLFSNRALVYLKLNKLPACMSDCDACLSLTPRFAKVLHTRFKALLALGNVERALLDIDRAIAVSVPGSAERSAFEAERKEVREKKARKEREEKERRERARKEAEDRRREEWEKTHPDWYKILGLARDASQDEIRKAFYSAARQHHPDKGGDEDKFKDIQAAYEVLGDADRRERYDAGEDDDDFSFFPGFSLFDILFGAAHAHAQAAAAGGGGDGGSGGPFGMGGGFGGGPGRGGGGTRGGRGGRSRGGG